MTTAPEEAGSTRGHPAGFPRVLLVIPVVFLAATSVAGGLALLMGAIAPPATLLEGSPFRTYTVPGVVLLAVVGGSAVAAGGLLLGRHALALRATVVAAAMIVSFEVVEILIIGSPPGIARNLQMFYLGLGAGIAALAGVAMRRRSVSSR